MVKTLKKEKAFTSKAFYKLSSFIVHDLKNVSNSLSLINQNAKNNMGDPDFQQDTIKTIESSVSRISELILTISSVSKFQKLKKRQSDLKTIIDKTVKSMAMNDLKNIIITNETDMMPPINVDSEALQMIFLNLFENAYDSIKAKGIIRVRAWSSLREEKEFINVTVTDNGRGMNESFVKNELFQPFKTTKPDGFGINLYLSKIIIENHGGDIKLESHEGKGSSFMLKLPLWKSEEFCL